MFKLIVTNKESGQVEQSDFKTQAECENHKALLETLGYSFVDSVNELNEVIPSSHSFEIVEDKKAEGLAKIAELEAKITPRRLRDALLGDKSFIEQIEAEIAEIRKGL